MQPRSSGRSPAFRAGRGAFAVLLALFVAAVVNAEPRAPQEKKEPDKKDPDKKEPTKPPEIKWPSEISGKDISGWVKDLDDPDPTIREYAARMLPQFGPAASKSNVSKALLRRMTAEKDPGVRAAVYGAVGGNQMENDADNQTALRLLSAVIDNPAGPHAGALRAMAVQTVAQFGSRGKDAIPALTGQALGDTAYQTRQYIAIALGQVGFNETTGPNMLALSRLADKLPTDDSAAVRMEAMRSLLLLGPPWSAPKQPGAKMPPPTDTKSVDIIIKHMRARVGDPKNKLQPTEKDKQVEIWARLVMMRFDPKEVNDENLDAFARYLTGADLGAKIQALQAIAMIGEGASKKVTDVVRVMEEKDAPVTMLIGAIQALASMGVGAKPALPNLKKMLEEKEKELAAKKLELARKKVGDNKNEELQLTGEVATLEEVIKLLKAVIKHIDESKPVSPAVTPSTSSSEPKKP